MGIKITLLDEINCHFSGLTKKQINHIIEQTKIMEKGAHMQASFKMKLWDGKTSLFDEEGFCFTYMIENIIDILEDYGVDLSNAEIVDERDSIEIPNIQIDENFLYEETGFTIKEHQLNSINASLSERKGVIDAATNAGKTVICLAISKALNPYIGSVIVVPDDYLANETCKLYEKSNLDYKLLNSKVKKKDRESLIKNTDHIVSTRKIFQNCIEYFSETTKAILIDELHEFGPRMEEVLRYDVGHFPVRIGMTGSLPDKDKLKREKIFGHLGGGVLEKVKGRHLMDIGFSSKINIRLFQTEDNPMKDLENTDEYDYSLERNYTDNNQHRAKAIADFLKSFNPVNTFVLCQPGMAEMLSKELGIQYIHQETSTKERQNLLSVFDEKGEFIRIATFKTGQRGISKNHIYRVVMIDAQEAITTSLQSIGRGMRLDGEINEFEVIDIGSDLKYGRRHQKERIKSYKKEQYDYQKEEEKIIVLGEE